MAKAKSEAEKWEKLHDQDTEHLASLQKRDNYGPIESLNEAAIRLSAELAEARRLNAQFLRERGEAEDDAEALTNELAETQTTLQFAKKEYHALFREFSILVKQRDTLAEALLPFSKMMGGHMFLNFDYIIKAEQALAAAILSTGTEPKDVLIESRKPNPNDCPKCGFGLSDEWPDGRRVCDDCDHEWFKAPDSSANNDKSNHPSR